MFGLARSAFQRLRPLTTTQSLLRIACAELSEAGEHAFHSSVNTHGRYQGNAKLAVRSAGNNFAVAAWSANNAHSTESFMVEDWLSELQLLDSDSRSVCRDLLAKHPGLLYEDPKRVTSIITVLMEATKAKQLFRKWFFSDKQILQIVGRYTPEALRKRLSELHQSVWQQLDSSNVGFSYDSQSSMDFLDLDARALANKALKLRELVPEFLPSTVLRGCPELLDLEPEDLARFIHKAGDVVVVGKNVSAEVQNSNNVVIYKKTPPLLASRYGSALPQPVPKENDVLRVLGNTRLLVYVADNLCDVRVEDPSKMEEEFAACGCHTAAPLR